MMKKLIQGKHHPVGKR